MANDNGTAARQEFLEVLRRNGELLATLIKWGSVLIGGLCLVIYTNELGRFPEGISLGEGLAFYLVSAAFCLCFIFYWIGITALGSALMRWPIEMWLYVDRRRSSKKTTLGGVPSNTSLSPMTSIEIVLIGLLGALLVLVMAYQSDVHWGHHLLPVALQGLLIGLWLIVRRRSEFDSAGLIITTDDPVASENAKKARRTLQSAIPFLMIIFPFILMPNKTKTVDLAFRLAQIRNESTTIHLQTPWEQPFKEAGLVAKPSFLGNAYSSFPCAKVLLYGIGNNVVVEIPSIPVTLDSGKCKPLTTSKPRTKKLIAVPADKVWVE